MPSSELTVLLCSGVGPDQVAGECDGSDTEAVQGQGSGLIVVDTDSLDADDESEPLTVLLTFLAECDESSPVTITADQPGNVGPDDVTINCTLPEETATPSLTPTLTPTPVTPPTATQPVPTATRVVETLTIRPPSTGDAGLADE